MVQTRPVATGGYSDAEAVAAVEAEATLALSGAVEITGILTVDTINEKTADNGVDIDDCKIKDGSAGVEEVPFP